MPIDADALADFIVSLVPRLNAQATEEQALVFMRQELLDKFGAEMRPEIAEGYARAAVQDQYRPAGANHILCPKCHRHELYIYSTYTDRMTREEMVRLNCPTDDLLEPMLLSRFHHLAVRKHSRRESLKHVSDIVRFRHFEGKERKDLSEEDQKKFDDLVAEENKKILNSTESSEKLAKTYREERDKLEKRKEVTGKSLFKIAKGQSKLSQRVLKGLTAAALIGVGAVLAANFQSNWFFIGFLAAAVMQIVPSPYDVEVPKEVRDHVKDLLKDEFGAPYAGTYRGEGKQMQKGTLADGLRLIRFMYSPSHWGPNGTAGQWRHAESGLTNTWGVIRTLLKVTAIWCFLQGILGNAAIPLVNLVTLIYSFVAFYSLSGEWDPHRPHQILECTIRLLFGFIIIPFYVMSGILGSIILSMIALAFLGFGSIPTPKTDNEKVTEMADMTELMSKMGFGIIMFLVLLMYLGVIGAGWAGTLPYTLKSTFVYFFVITGIAGLFSNIQARPAVGLLMLSVAMIIYGIGPGAQETGTALLGEWYPTVQTMLSDLGEPIGQAFGQFGSTFGDAFLLISSPSAYAQRILSGNYQKDAVTGLAGAFGLEVDEFRLTPITPNQPYNIYVKLSNKGSSDARNVQLSLFTGANPPKRTGGFFGYSEFQKNASLGVFGFTNNAPSKTACFAAAQPYTSSEPSTAITHCVQQVGTPNPSAPQAGGTMPILDVQQAVFISRGVLCTDVVDFDLRRKVVPLSYSLSYGYNSSSSLTLDVLSTEEWTRLASAGKLKVEAKKPSTLTNAPARLNLDVPQQPLREGSPLWIGFTVVTAKGETSRVERVHAQVEYPTSLGESLSPECKKGEQLQERNGETVWKLFSGSGRFIQKGAVNSIVWDALPPSNTILCQFNPATTATPGEQPTGSKPASKTFLIQANATYDFQMWGSKDAKIEFGGVTCCGNPGRVAGNIGAGELPTYTCPAGQTCNDETKTCAFQEAGTGGRLPAPGEPGYCAAKIAGQLGSDQDKCLLGEAQCSSTAECGGRGYDTDKDGTADIICRLDVASGTCCPSDLDPAQCLGVRQAWLQGKSVQEREQLLPH